MQTLKLQAKERLLATADIVQDTVPPSSYVAADVDEDARTELERQLGKAEHGEHEAEKAGDDVAESRYKDLMSEMDTALSRGSDSVAAVKANDTSDQPGMTVADPALRPQLQHALGPEGMLTLNASLFNETELKELAQLNAKDSLVQADTEDPISDGAAYDLLVDGDPSEEEPVVQELTNNDGSTEAPDDQPLLVDDVPPAIPVMKA